MDHSLKPKLYSLSPGEQVELKKFIDKNLQKGFIRESKSHMASPFFFIKKENGKLWPVMDYHKLNEITIKNKYPLPIIQELLDLLAEAIYFSLIDVDTGYNNVCMKEGSEKLATFITNLGMYEPLVMFFGLTNSPATFQTMVNTLFKDLIYAGKVAIYMDDILVFSKTMDNHIKMVQKVLQILQDNDLYLQSLKCHFHKKKINYLGYVISHGHLEIDPIKVARIMEWPTPGKVKEVQSFLGFYNFYRRFIKDYSKIARPLFELTQKERTWDWTPACKEVFQTLKRIFTESPVLIMPDTRKPFHIECDSSNFATRAVLSQVTEDGKWHPCAYISKSLSSTERNYPIYDKELLAVV